MDIKKLDALLEEYVKSPKEFQVANYWASYEKKIINVIRDMDFNHLRSGKYPILSTFGFIDGVYTYHPSLSFGKKFLLKFIQKYIIGDRSILPYKLSTSDIQEMAYLHCKLMSEITNSVPISDIEVSSFGGPKDLFEIDGKKYTVPFLSYYRRYCFAQKHIAFKGNEIIVELGSGSGYQIEVLKKLYPNMTVLCFDLPSQLYLCEKYLIEALGEENIVGIDETITWEDFSRVQKGKVHFFGSWKVPLLINFDFDVFWNAASFGEMEPEIVENYLTYIKGKAKWIYLLQARHGKETTGETHVINPITIGDYKNFLSDYNLLDEQDAWHAHKRLSQTGGYFEAIWVKK